MRSDHPFRDRWNHNTHYYPLLAARIATAATVLDIGCGEGTFCRFAEPHRDLVVGADRDLPVLPRGPGRFVAASAEALPFRDAAFEAVVMAMVLHHIDADRALTEARRVLRPGGVLLVLGYGGFGGWRDVPAEARDLLTHRLLSRRRKAWEPPTAKVEPAGTWAEARATAERLLPGCTYRRLPMWRYLVEWRRPPG